MFLDVRDRKFGASVGVFGLKFLVDGKETVGTSIGSGNGGVRRGSWLGVRMVTGQSVWRDVEMFKGVGGEAGDRCGSAVGDDVAGNSVESEYLSNEEVSELGSVCELTAQGEAGGFRGLAEN